MRDFVEGDRVYVETRGIGIVEEVDDFDGHIFLDVNLLTPDNERSIMTTYCSASQATHVADHVVPMPKSDSWYKQSDEFTAVVSALLDGEVD